MSYKELLTVLKYDRSGVSAYVEKVRAFCLKQANFTGKKAIERVFAETLTGLPEHDALAKEEFAALNYIDRVKYLACLHLDAPNRRVFETKWDAIKVVEVPATEKNEETMDGFEVTDVETIIV